MRRNGRLITHLTVGGKRQAFRGQQGRGNVLTGLTVGTLDRLPGSCRLEDQMRGSRKRTHKFLVLYLSTESGANIKRELSGNSHKLLIRHAQVEKCRDQC